MADIDSNESIPEVNRSASSRMYDVLVWTLVKVVGTVFGIISTAAAVMAYIGLPIGFITTPLWSYHFFGFDWAIMATCTAFLVILALIVREL